MAGEKTIGFFRKHFPDVRHGAGHTTDFTKDLRPPENKGPFPQPVTDWERGPDPSLILETLTTLHLGSGHVSRFIQEIEVAALLFHAHLGDLFRFAAFFAAARHLSPRDISLLINEIEIPFLPFDSRLRHFFCHGNVTSSSVIFVPAKTGSFYIRRKCPVNLIFRRNHRLRADSVPERRHTPTF